MKTTFIPRLTAGLHTEGAGGSRRKGFAFGEPVILDRLFPRGRWGLARLLCGVLAVLAVGGAIVLTLVLRGDWGGSGGKPDHPGGDQQQGGIPPAETAETAETAGGTEGGEQTLPAEDGDATVDGSGAESDEVGGNPSEETTADGGENVPSDPSHPGEGVTEPGDSEQTTVEPPPHGGEPGGETEGGSDTPPDTAPETDSAAEPETEAAPSVPEGCYPIESADMSEPDRGAGYIVGEMTGLPDALPEGSLWGSGTPPTVLIINTHPYESYGDGKAWYDPSSGGLALADTPSDTDGTVALAAALGRTLRGMGVTVMHLRIAVSAEDSAADIYNRTETVVRSYCRLYPDIGLVLDLRRSAELTAAGGILRTEGTWEGETCAQIRLSVSGGREEDAVGWDLAAALVLRRELWAAEPSISRPVRVKPGSGIAGDLSDVRILTLEMGSAGNVYDQALRLVDPLAAAIGRVTGN